MEGMGNMCKAHETVIGSDVTITALPAEVRNKHRHGQRFRRENARANQAHVIESSLPRQKARSKDCRESSKNSASRSLQPVSESAPQVPARLPLTTKGATK
jgi:hypothetical protein